MLSSRSIFMVLPILITAADFLVFPVLFIPFGMIAAILALDGRDGQFGVKPGASRALPPLE